MKDRQKSYIKSRYNDAMDGREYLKTLADRLVSLAGEDWSNYQVSQKLADIAESVQTIAYKAKDIENIFFVMCLNGEIDIDEMREVMKGGK